MSRSSWFEHQPACVKSGERHLGEFSETLSVGALTISLCDDGIHLEFPRNWPIGGLRDRWVEMRAKNGTGRLRQKPTPATVE